MQERRNGEEAAVAGACGSYESMRAKGEGDSRAAEWAIAPFLSDHPIWTGPARRLKISNRKEITK